MLCFTPEKNLIIFRVLVTQKFRSTKKKIVSVIIPWSVQVDFFVQGCEQRWVMETLDRQRLWEQSGLFGRRVQNHISLVLFMM